MTDQVPAATAEAIARLVAFAKQTRGASGLLLAVSGTAKALAAELLARDRYANEVINYLLQRIEASAGIVILASNLRPKLDPAILKRFRVVA